MHEHCKGCLTYNKNGDECGISKASILNSKGDCPCTNCLIKAMCQDECNNYNDFQYYIEKLKMKTNK